MGVEIPSRRTRRRYSTPEGAISTEILHRSLGERLRAARTQAGLSQESLAKAALTTRSTVAMAETGRAGLSIDVLYALASALDVDIATLLPSVAEVRAAGAERFGGSLNERALADVMSATVRSTRTPR